MNTFDSFFSGMRIATSGLKAERMRMDVIARNIAHSQTTNLGDGEPYRRQVVHFAPVLQRTADGKEHLSGVEVTGVHPDDATPFEEIHDPTHPDADARGIVRMPNVNTMREMADLITASRAYEANLTLQETFDRIAERSLRLAE